MMQPKDEKALQALFESHMAGDKLTPEELSALEAHPLWGERLAAYRQMSALESSLMDEPVPTWNRDAGFEQYLAQPGWWQRQGMATLALCFSLFACFVMVLDVRFIQSDQGMSLAWSGSVKKDEMNERVIALAEKNNAEIGRRLDAFQQMYQQNTAQMVSYVMANSRTERKEDIADVVQLLQQQRDEDLDYLKQQFDDINYQFRLASQRNKALARDAQDQTTILTEE